MEQNKLGKNKIKYMTINVYKPASYIEGPDTLKHRNRKNHPRDQTDRRSILGS